MPIYEYRCNSCNRRVSLFVRSLGSSSSPSCTVCGSDDVKRLMSSFAHHRSESDRLSGIKDADFKDPSFYKDSRNVGLWAKKRIQELGGEVPPQFDEIVEKGRSGELLKEYDDRIG